MENFNFKPKPIIALRGYTRSGSFPLDDTSFFDDYLSAKEYVQTSPLVYPGQIISVDDSLRKKTRIYKVSYDNTADAEFKYYLEEISVGSSSLGFVNYKGSLNSKAELENIPDPKKNDFYYVRNEETGIYEAYIYTGTKWDQVDLGIGLASQEQNGLISKELYVNLSGQNYAGIYYHPGASKMAEAGEPNVPEQGYFIELQTSGEDDEKIIQTADKLKETIYNIMETTPPYVKLVKNYKQNEFSLNTELWNLTIDIEYYHVLGGDINTVQFCSNYLKTPQKDLFFYKDDFIYDTLKKCWKLKNPLVFNYLKLDTVDPTDHKMVVTVTYDENSRTLYPAGSCEDFIQFKIIQPLLYSYAYYYTDPETGRSDYIIEKEYGNSSQYLAKENHTEIITLYSEINGISAFGFRSPKEIKSIEYEQQGDKYFLNLMNQSILEDGWYEYTYKYEYLDEENKIAYPYLYPIKSPMTFIINM